MKMFNNQEVNINHRHNSIISNGVIPGAHIGIGLRSKPILLLVGVSTLLFGLVNVAFIGKGEGVFFRGNRFQRMLSSSSELVEDKGNVNTEDGPTLVFIMGIEGTGHHLLGNLLSRSPNMKTAKDLGICTELKEMNGILRKGMKKLFLNPNLRSLSGIDAYDSVVSNMVSIRSIFKKWRQGQQQEEGGEGASMEPTGKPFNIAITSTSCGGPAELSYPDFLGVNRALQNFNLDVYYSMCSDAQVKCSHLYIYRDPYDVLRSTTINRQFNPDILYGIQLYTSVAHQVHSQLISHPTNLAGCFGPLDHRGAKIQTDWEAFGEMFGWNVHGDDELKRRKEDDQSQNLVENFLAATESVVKSKPPMEESLKKEMVPRSMLPAMKALEDVHYRVVDLCYNTNAKNIDEQVATATSFEVNPVMSA